MDKLDDLNTIRVPRQPQSKILNNDFVISSFDQSFRFFHLARRIYLESMAGEIVAHRKTDRLLIVDHEQTPRARFGAIVRRALFPPKKKLFEAARHAFEVQH